MEALAKSLTMMLCLGACFMSGDIVMAEASFTVNGNSSVTVEAGEMVEFRCDTEPLQFNSKNINMTNNTYEVAANCSDFGEYTCGGDSVTVKSKLMLSDDPKIKIGLNLAYGVFVMCGYPEMTRHQLVYGKQNLTDDSKYTLVHVKKTGEDNVYNFKFKIFNLTESGLGKYTFLIDNGAGETAVDIELSADTVEDDFIIPVATATAVLLVVLVAVAVIFVRLYKKLTGFKEKDFRNDFTSFTRGEDGCLAYAGYGYAAYYTINDADVVGDSVEDLAYNIYDECKDTDPEPEEKPSDLDPAEDRKERERASTADNLKKDYYLSPTKDVGDLDPAEDRKERERATTADNLKKDYYLSPTKDVGDLDPLEPPEGDTDEADVTPRDQEGFEDNRLYQHTFGSELLRTLDHLTLVGTGLGATGVDTSYASPYGLGVSNGVADIRDEDGYLLPCKPTGTAAQRPDGTPRYREDDRDSQNRLGSDSSKNTEHPTPEGTEKKTYYSSLDARDEDGYLLPCEPTGTAAQRPVGTPRYREDDRDSQNRLGSDSSKTTEHPTTEGTEKKTYYSSLDARDEDGYLLPCKPTGTAAQQPDGRPRYREEDRDSQNRLGSDSSKTTEHPTPEGTGKKTYYSSLDARNEHGYGSINQ
ncbi:uncharacterized protein LOC124120530 [Haliotis rufescens]|uniref:uncharacterized protein LOC124120530 n=1 Tax=Haliotis rufescens TaxID=6454 RepID=UPI00201F58E4|nr:uncharacterized protein LOC124120530 [Haliotis rufescens]